MDAIIEKAKELGLIIKEDTRVKRVAVAQVAFSADFALQKNLKEFNDSRDKMMEMMNEGVEDTSLIDPLNDKIKALYEVILETPAWKEYSAAQEEMGKLMEEVNNVINFMITGEEACSSSKCASCGGCS